MTLRQLRTWITDRLKEAEPLDSPSTMEDPQHVAVTATKKLGLMGHGSGKLLAKAGRVETPFECASVLIDCLASLPGDGPADPNTLSPSDVARTLSVSADTVLGWIRARELRASDIAARDSNRPRWIITRDALDAFLRNRQPEPQAPSPTRRNETGFNRY